MDIRVELGPRLRETLAPRDIHITCGQPFSSWLLPSCPRPRRPPPSLSAAADDVYAPLIIVHDPLRDVLHDTDALRDDLRPARHSAQPS